MVSENCKSDSETPLISFHNIKQEAPELRVSSVYGILLNDCSNAIIWTEFSRSHVSISMGFSYHSQGTESSAPKAVLEISFRGGVGVIPVRYIFEKPAPSAVRKRAPTFCSDRILSRSKYRSWLMVRFDL